MSKSGVKNKPEVRELIKTVFVREYAELFKEAGKYCYPTKRLGHRSEAGKKVIELARKRIGYSNKYASMDIYRNLYNIYKEIFLSL